MAARGPVWPRAAYKIFQKKYITNAPPCKLTLGIYKK